MRARMCKTRGFDGEKQSRIVKKIKFSVNAFTILDGEGVYVIFYT